MQRINEIKSRLIEIEKRSVRLANSQANFRKEKIQMNKIKDNEGTFHQKVKKSIEP